MIPDRRSGDGQEGGKTIQKYQAIYADPPWDYQQCRLSGSAKKHYPTMRIEELCALPVAEIADRDCALFVVSGKPRDSSVVLFISVNLSVRKSGV